MSRTAFRSFVDPFSQRAAHILLDFPGFGRSPLPSSTWGVENYADDLADIIRPYRQVKKIVYVGHSFGGRVGLKLAAKYPELVDALFLVGSAGLPPKRGILKTLRVKARIYAFKAMKCFALALGKDVEALRTRFGSEDYRSSGSLRPIFLRIISEDLSEDARRIKCPVALIYGESDTSTPPEIGERLKGLIPDAELTVLPGQDHHSVLGEGRHVVISRLSRFIESLS